MKVCKKCGKPLPENAVICVNCGQSVIFGINAKQAPKRRWWLPLVIIVGSILATVGIFVLVMLFAIDRDPVSQEEIMEYEEKITEEVYWQSSGKVFHTHLDCGHIANSVSLMQGSVEEAIKAGKTRLCKSCAAKDGIDTKQ